MDTEYDIISPEFFYLLFFKQKSLIIYPYLDLKHLIPLECFLVGYNIEKLDGTALYNLSEIIEYGSISTHNHNPTFFIITNVNREEIEKLIKIKNFHCIINTKEEVSDNLISNSDFVVYNKKTKTFLNQDFSNIDLSFETEIIQKSSSLEFLADEIQSIKNLGNRIYLEFNKTGKIEDIIYLLSELKPQYHKKILEFVSNYYDIVIPISISKELNQPNKNTGSKIIEQYQKIQKINLKIFSIFKTLLQDYKKNFDDSNLATKQLFPKNFFVYLREHHWKNGIPRKFLNNWHSRYISQMNPNEEDYTEFKQILSILNVSEPEINSLFIKILSTKEKKKSLIINNSNSSIDFNLKGTDIKEIPSINNIDKFEKWILNKLDQIDSILEKKQLP
ncbi:MAG: hypothetical protein KAX33_01250 [Candidatus Lokiarchaeota archaeon]|nr:hypothetical protein [Candidatus Lokiarchaeota archaeon]